MSVTTNIDFDKLHVAIQNDIQSAFPDFQIVEFYRGEGLNDRKTLQTPACLLDMTEFENSNEGDPGTGQLAVIASFEAELIISFKTPNAKRTIRKMAAGLAAWIHNRRWVNPDDSSKKIPSGNCVVVGAYRDDFRGLNSGERDRPLDQFEVWKVEWRQEIHIGESVWNETGLVPNQIFLGLSPEIGPPHVDDYIQVAGTP